MRRAMRFAPDFGREFGLTDEADLLLPADNIRWPGIS